MLEEDIVPMFEEICKEDDFTSKYNIEANSAMLTQKDFLEMSLRNMAR